MIERTLIIRAEPLEMIFVGTKDWEIRSRPTRIRGRIALSEKGANAIVGTCTLHDVKGPLSIEDVLKNARRMGYTRAEIEADLAGGVAIAAKGYTHASFATCAACDAPFVSRIHPAR